MRIQLTQDGYYPRREIREIVQLAKRHFEKHSDRTPPVFLIHIGTRPRIRHMKLRISGVRSISLTLSRIHCESRLHLAKQIGYLMYRAFHPHMEEHRWLRIYHTPFEAPEGFDEKPLVHVPPPVKCAPKLNEKYEKCLAQVGLAQARVTDLQKKLARAETHLSKKQREAKKRLHNLTKPLPPSAHLSDNELTARLQRLRQRDQ